MILESLTLNNFRVFSGEHEISFFDKKTTNRPVILFGGLNGAGKTSILTAIRLVILGKRSFGTNVSNKQYQKELGELIHKSKDFTLVSDASVELTFSYVKFGEKTQYRVKRSWTEEEDSEKLVIWENGFALTELTNDQAQSFLMDLVPSGIADLFFFDGEKIKELAESSDDQVLSDALKKMIGVDFIERAVSDLTIFLRNKKKHSASEEVKREIDELSQKLSEKEKSIEPLKIEIGELKTSLVHESKQLAVISAKVKEEGGDWAKSREQMLVEYSGLEHEKQQIISSCQDQLKQSYPFSVAPDFMNKLLKAAQKTANTYESEKYNQKLSEKYEVLKDFFVNKGLEIDSDEFQQAHALLMEPIAEKPLSYVPQTTLLKISNSHQNLKRDKKLFQERLGGIRVIDQKLDDIDKNLARVPDHETLVKQFENLRQQENKVKELQDQIDEKKHQGQKLVNECIDITRKLDKLSNQIVVAEEDQSTLVLAQRSSEAMSELTGKLTALKVKEIEEFFKSSFARMARKDDMQLFAEIAPETFNVNLFSKDTKQLIEKKQLSAGEKQIYALAMIEALGKASGRKLPLIIDTPLGRLDSKHRRKIVQEFFPKVNDQVVILSTDTEVDEQFFEDLSPYISKSYELVYDVKSGASHVESGYFWKG